MTNTQVLVTGGAGFVASNVILQLLQKGYHVRATLRSLSRQAEVIDMMRNGGLIECKQLSFVEADLTDDANWDMAASGCAYVMHIASPICLRLPRREDEMIRPAVDGTLRVLRSALKAGARRVVMTSNFGAVGYGHKKEAGLITEKSWTDPNQRGLSAYNKSKVMAELAAWNFIRSEGLQMELSIINPMAIFGPALGPSLSSGSELLKNIISGSMKAVPKLGMGIVDVRDLADLHIRAMTHPSAAGERFLALSGGVVTLPQIAILLKHEMPEASANVSLKVLPNAVVRLASLFNAEARAIAPMLGIDRNASNEKARTLLGWHPRTNEEALLATAESLLRFGHIQ
ncbi:MAG: aldehyde reductase [Tannerellaceae bacterium]|jgi:dihydroflavonol-4-reductase|nr:aldehyde reductase [Tannerellaceae bacterium]